MGKIGDYVRIQIVGRMVEAGIVPFGFMDQKPAVPVMVKDG